MNSEPRSSRVEASGSYIEGTLEWGWVCERCRESEGGFHTASRAREEADNHDGLCDA